MATTEQDQPTDADVKPTDGEPTTVEPTEVAATDTAEPAASTPGSATKATSAKARKEAKDAQVKASAASRREELRRQQEAEAAKRRRARMLGLGLGLLLAILLVVGIVYAIQLTGRSLKAEPENASPQGDAIVVAPGKMKDGVKTVALYTDFQCPFCKKFEDKYGAELVRLAEAGDIRLEMHTMTFLDGNIPGDHSLRAARGAACATQVGKYVDYFKAVYAHQPAKEGEGYTEDTLRKQVPDEAGIKGGDLEKFQKCYDGKAVDGWLKAANEKNMKALMDNAGADQRWGTPALLVNGKMADFGVLTEGDTTFGAPAEKIKLLIDETK